MRRTNAQSVIQQCSKCGPWINSFTLTWEVAENAFLGATRIRASGVRPSIWSIACSAGDIYAHQREKARGLSSLSAVDPTSVVSFETYKGPWVPRGAPPCCEGQTACWAQGLAQSRHLTPMEWMKCYGHNVPSASPYTLHTSCGLLWAKLSPTSS